MTTATTFENPGDLLLAAADHMTRFGFHQHGYYPGDATDLYAAPCCMLGAIRAVAHVQAELLEEPHYKQPPLVQEAEDILAEMVLGVGGKVIYDANDIDPVETVGDWNDADNCDADSAIELLRDAAELAR